MTRRGDPILRFLTSSIRVKLFLMDEFFDTHAHLDFYKTEAEQEAVIERARAAGVRWMIAIGAGNGLSSSERALKIAETHEGIWATVGVHPHDAKMSGPDDVARLRELARHPQCVALGEIGLDYAKEYSPRAVQVARFRDQLALARELDLPVVIHDREAHDDFLRVIKEDGLPRAGGIMHCFSGSLEMAQDLVQRDFYISFPGVVTFKNAKLLPAAAKALPIDRVLIETDSPFLAPEPYRGRQNEPAYVIEVAKTIAALRGLPLSEFARASVANAFRAFRIRGQS